jgi:hypothetical protein
MDMKTVVSACATREAELNLIDKELELELIQLLDDPVGNARELGLVMLKRGRISVAMLCRTFSLTTGPFSFW